MENEDMKDRIRELMQSQNLTQQAFAQQLGISPASLSSIFQARTRPTLTHVDAIMKSYPNVNLEWLLYGEGSMFKDGKQAGLLETVVAHDGVTEPSLNFDDGPALAFTDEPSPTPQQGHGGMQNQAPVKEKEIIKYVDKPQRKITEIRIFYDDQTWETFVPKK